LKHLHDLLDGGSTHAGREERLANVSLAPEKLPRSITKLPCPQAEHGRKVRQIHTAEKWGQSAVRQLMAVRIQQRVLVSLAPLKNQLLPGPIADLALNSQLGVVMEEVVSGLAMDAEEQIPDGSEQGAFACLIGTVNDMEIAGLVCEPKIQIRERSEGRDV
jgi:hypothetical protein